MICRRPGARNPSCVVSGITFTRNCSSHLPTMKTKLLLIAVLGLAVTGAFAAKAVSSAASVEVTFSNPEKFSDVKEDYYDSGRARETILDELKSHIVSRAAKLL